MPDPQTPRVLGRYALHDRIASGGMASVHLGRLLGPVGFARTVAIKRLHPEFASDPEFAAMFLDEARLVARISHPNVVPTLDVVATQGELFIVMEYVRGEALSSLVRASIKKTARIPPAMAATILSGVLHGLHAAHEAKSERGEPLRIVHRDVSPQNILVGVDGVARVLDFGVAKAAGRVHTTRDGQLKGKLAYMAPEQVRGAVTRTTDVYAASVVLWEVLAGRNLFTGSHEGAILANVLQGCSEPPSAYADDIPSSLDAVVMRGLRIDPAERFATAREMARALESAIGLLPPSTVGEWVESLAGATLLRRSEHIAAIESDPSPPSPEGSEQAPPSKQPLSAPAEAKERALPSAPDAAPTKLAAGMPQEPLGADVPTQLSSASALPVQAPARGRPNLRLAATVLGALGLLVLGGLAATWLRPAGSPPVSATFGGALSGGEPPSSTARDPGSLTAPTASPQPPAGTAPAVTPAPEKRDEPVVTPQKPAAEPRATTVRRPPIAAPPAKNCNPPYSYDSRGLKVFKKECL